MLKRKEISKTIVKLKIKSKKNHHPLESIWPLCLKNHMLRKESFLQVLLGGEREVSILPRSSLFSSRHGAGQQLPSSDPLYNLRAQLHHLGYLAGARHSDWKDNSTKCGDQWRLLHKCIKILRASAAIVNLSIGIINSDSTRYLDFRERQNG